MPVPKIGHTPDPHDLEETYSQENRGDTIVVKVDADTNGLKNRFEAIARSLEHIAQGFRNATVELEKVEED